MEHGKVDSLNHKEAAGMYKHTADFLGESGCLMNGLFVSYHKKGCRELKHRRRMCDIAPENVCFGLFPPPQTAEQKGESRRPGLGDQARRGLFYSLDHL